MGDTNKGKDQSAASRQAAQDRRTAAGKDPKSFGPGGNPDGTDEETEDETSEPTA